MMDYRAQRRYYRAQRRAYRRQMRGYYGGGFGGLVFLIVLASMALSHLWILWPLAFFGIPFFLFVLRPIFFGSANAMNQQQYSQPQQEQPIYQQPYQPEQPVYQPYTQGYAAQQPPAQQAEVYQEGGQQYQYPAQQAQQYEEPMTMYPQE